MSGPHDELMVQPPSREENSRYAPYMPRLVQEWLANSPGERYLPVEGTLAFIDISGFTRLSERLARKGREGAEDVTSYLNVSFARMLEIADRAGGDLLKYGGDALLLLFTGDGHAVRACGAVHAARRSLREARVGASEGLPPLRMSAGLHSGIFDCFLVGRSHRELVITGESVTRTAEMEGKALAGEILMSEATASLLHHRALGKSRSGGWLLARAPDQSREPLANATSAPNVDLSVAVPLALRPHLASASAAGEHRLATVAFVKYTGMDRLLASLGPSAAVEALEGLIVLSQSAAEEFGVAFLSTDIDIDGGKITLVAGVPSAGEDDTGRLLLAARRIVASNGGLAVRAGVNRGFVFAGDVGGADRRAYTVIGDAVNLAARVMTKAAPGQVLATSEAIAYSAVSFALSRIESFAVKGKSALVEASVVGELRETAHDGTPRFRLVGRDTELQQLLAALDRARSGAGSGIEISGDGGLGKTRLIEELISLGTETPVFETRAGPYATHSAYFPFRRLLRSVIELSDGGDEAALAARVLERAPGLSPWLPLLGDVMDIPCAPTPAAASLGPRFRPARTHRAVRELLECFVPGPALFVFEDSAWHDAATRELLRDLIRAGESHPWLFIVTARQSDPALVALPNCTTLRLAPLPDEAGASLVREALAEKGHSRTMITAVVAHAAGNPLFLLELAAAAAAGRSTDELPTSVESLVGARIDELPPAGRQLVRYAAVVGAVFDPALVRAAFEGEGLAAFDASAFEHLGAFVERDVAGEYRFRHRLYRETAYEGLPFRTRRRLHTRLLEVFEERAGSNPESFAELLSVHATRAKDHARSWRYSVVAGERARAKYANLEAAEFFGQAVQAARALQVSEPLAVARVAEARGDALELAGRYDEAARSLKEARQFAADAPLVIARLLRKQGALHERTGAYRKALIALSRARAILDAAPVDSPSGIERMQVLVGMGAVRFRQGRYAQSGALVGQGIETVERIAGYDRVAREGMAHAYYLLGHARSFLGQASGEDLRERALGIYEELGDFVGQSNALNNLGVAAYYAGDLDRAVDLWERSEAACARAGDVIGEARQQNNIGEVLSDRGQLDRARSLFEAAGETFNSAGHTIGEALTLSNLGRVATREGKTVEAEVLLSTALGMFRHIGASAFACEADVRIVENFVAAASWDEGARHAEDLLLRAPRDAGIGRQESALARLRGMCLAALGNTEAARQSLEQAVSVARKRGSAPDETAARAALSALAQA